MGLKSSRRKTGSGMSDRQMARAAVDGRLITFIQQLRMDWDEPNAALSGFLVGMDDYHWMIVPDSVNKSEDLPVILVHKSCPFVMISRDVFLGDQPEPFRAAVRKIGSGFWSHCRQEHLGYTATTSQEKK